MPCTCCVSCSDYGFLIINSDKSLYRFNLLWKPFVVITDPDLLKEVIALQPKSFFYHKFTVFSLYIHYSKAILWRCCSELSLL